MKQIARWYLKVIEAICVALLMLILICMCIQITCRLFTVGQNFTEELSRLSFSLMIFLGAPLALAEGADIAVDMLVNALPKGLQRVVNILVNLLVAAFAVLCLRSLTTLIGSNQGVSAVSMTWIKMNWLYYVFFFSFLCLAVTAVVKAAAVGKGASPCLDINEAEKELAKQQEEEVDLGL